MRPFVGEKSVRLGLVIGQLDGGGAEGQLYELVRGLDRSSFAPVVYCLGQASEPYGSRLEVLGVRVRVLRRRGHADLGRVLGLAAALRSDRCALVHAFLPVADIYTAAAAALARVPVVIASVRNLEPRHGRVLEASLGWALRRATGVICNSRRGAEEVLARFGVPRERLVVVLNGVDTGRFRPAGVPARRPGPLIGCAGRLVPQKNPALFVDAAAALVARIRDARLVLYGEGPERGAVERRIAACGLEEVVSLPGSCPDLAPILAGLDVFWLTSDWEGLPNVVLEAMACGVPVVATRVGGVAEAVRDGETGYLVKPGDAAALAARTAELLAHRERRLAMGCAARQWVEEEFGLARMVRRTREVYQRALAGQGALTGAHSEPATPGTGGERMAI